MFGDFAVVQRRGDERAGDSLRCEAVEIATMTNAARGVNFLPMRARANLAEAREIRPAAGADIGQVMTMMRWGQNAVSVPNGFGP